MSESSTVRILPVLERRNWEPSLNIYEGAILQKYFYKKAQAQIFNYFDKSFFFAITNNSNIFKAFRILAKNLNLDTSGTEVVSWICFIKSCFKKNNSQKNTCARVTLLIKLRVEACNVSIKRWNNIDFG